MYIVFLPPSMLFQTSRTCKLNRQQNCWNALSRHTTYLLYSIRLFSYDDDAVVAVAVRTEEHTWQHHHPNTQTRLSAYINLCCCCCFPKMWKHRKRNSIWMNEPTHVCRLLYDMLHCSNYHRTLCTVTARNLLAIDGAHRCASHWL